MAKIEVVPSKTYRVITPFTLTVADVAVPLFNVLPHSAKISWLTVKLRSLGATTTKVSLGDRDAQAIELTAAKESYTFDCPHDGGIDASTIWAIADHADGVVLEISGLYYNA